MSSNPRLDAALMVLRNTGHRIGDVHIPPPPQALEMRVWIDGVSCTLEDVMKMVEEEIKNFSAARGTHTPCQEGGQVHD